MPSSQSSPTKSKKKGGGFLNRQAAKSKKSDDSITEEQLLQKTEPITVDDVLMLERATESKFDLIFTSQQTSRP